MSQDDHLTRQLGELAPPPMSPALAGAAASAAPVRTRVPVRSFAFVAAVALLLAVGVVAFLGLRRDAAALPLPWLVGFGAVFALAGPFLLARAILPPAGQVLPSPARAGRSALVVAVGLVVLGLVATIDAPGVTVQPRSFTQGFLHCAGISLPLILPILLAGALVLRRVYPMGAGQVAAGIGAAAGAWAGLVLHLICPIGGPAHVGFAHGGAATIGAAVGALLLTRVLR